MTIKEQQELKKLIKEASIEALKSTEAREVIKGATLEALKSKEGENIILDYLTSYFHEIIEPALDDILHEIKTLKIEVKYIKDNHGTRVERLERKAGLAV